MYAHAKMRLKLLSDIEDKTELVVDLTGGSATRLAITEMNLDLTFDILSIP